MTRTTNPVGAPCWADLWTSDAEGSRRFYGELFGWGSDDPNPEFGGYFMFTRQGVPVAGAMGDMGDVKANDTWKIYLATPDTAKTLELATRSGAEVVVPATPVGEAGIQGVLVDPGGASVGVWQTLQFPGFTVLGEPAAPSWFELLAPDCSRSLAFYRDVFGWAPEMVGDSGFGYHVVRSPDADEDLAGVIDASGLLAPGAPAQWSVYWHVDDTDAALSKVQALGGSVLVPVEDTPLGRLATVADPVGAPFKLRTPPGV